MTTICFCFGGYQLWLDNNWETVMESHFEVLWVCGPHENITWINLMNCYDASLIEFKLKRHQVMQFCIKFVMLYYMWITILLNSDWNLTAYRLTRGTQRLQVKCIMCAVSGREKNICRQLIAIASFWMWRF